MRLKLFMFTPVMYFATMAMNLHGQCATVYEDTSTDGVSLYAWSTMTDNYTSQFSGCDPGWGSFTHSYTLTAQLYSPTGRVSYGNAGGSAGQASGTQYMTANTALAINGEEGIYSLRANSRIDCSVARLGFFQNASVVDWEIRVKTSYYDNSGGNQIISGRKFCNMRAACSSGMPSCFPYGTTVQVAASALCPSYWVASWIAVKKTPQSDWACTLSVGGPTGGPGPCN